MKCGVSIPSVRVKNSPLRPCYNWEADPYYESNSSIFLLNQRCCADIDCFTSRPGVYTSIVHRLASVVRDLCCVMVLVRVCASQRL